MLNLLTMRMHLIVDTYAIQKISSINKAEVFGTKHFFINKHLKEA